MQSLRVVEVPEFRRLLVLLREGLGDKGIPGRSKVRDTIMDSVDDFFKSLNDDLQVISV
jgi:hypothetical protein